MTVYSIGREAGCNIVIDDRTDVISRRHATLNVESNGKMTIIDQSSNGTYVNGIRITSGVPVPVTRKDNISFAHVARLDWNRIPNPRADIIRWVSIAVVALLLIGGGIFLYGMLTKEPEPPAPTPAPTMFTPEEVEQRAREKSDSIQKHVRDSLRQDSIRRDSIRRAEAKKQPAKQQSKKPGKPRPTTPAKPEPKKPTRLGR